MEYFKDCMNKEQLEAAHKMWVKKLHPDLNPGNPNATADFQEMQAQYEERLAELNGDYTKARKGRERREREAKERAERERKEREQRKVELVIEQARLNRQKSHRELKAGDYVYARMVQNTHKTYNWDTMTCEDLLWVVAEHGVKEECVVKIEVIVDETADSSILGCGYCLHKGMPDGVWGGYEVLQSADPAAGIRKGRRVSKVVMFRSPSYCVFGNPMGDQVITDYYMPVNYEKMFSVRLGEIHARIAEMQQEKARIEAERKAKLLAEQTPLIEEWQDKLIGISLGLTQKERQTVALNNLKTVLKAKFPGVTFRTKEDKFGIGNCHLQWEDGPTLEEVDKVIGLFEPWVKFGNELTPWQQQFGRIAVTESERKMSTLTKARILQQLGQVTEAFRNGGMHDEITVNDFDWMMLHLLVGIRIEDAKHGEMCMHTMHADGTRSVNILSAVRFVFKHSSYAKTSKKVKKTKP